MIIRLHLPYDPFRSPAKVQATRPGLYDVARIPYLDLIAGEHNTGTLGTWAVRAGYVGGTWGTWEVGTWEG